MSPGSSGHVHMQKGQPFYVKYREIIRRLMFLIGALLVFRLGAHIPVPGINNAALDRLFNANQGTILGLFNMFSGGALERMSILALGIMPYISASIIVQLMSTVVPSLEALKKEGEQGKRKINQYTRQGTLLLAFVQAMGMCAGLISQGITLSTGLGFYVPAVTSLVAGTMFLMWLGEQITERGVGNGISMIIFAGIVATLPTHAMQTFSAIENGQSTLIGVLVLIVITIAVMAAIIFIEKAQRRVPVNYAQKQQGRRIFTAQQTHLPLKINMAGVIPAIFASSLLLFPASLGHWIGSSDANASFFKRSLQDLALVLSPGQPLYLVLFGSLIIFFCYFYTALVFSPKEVAENLKRSGAYVPGIRPGEQTARYLDHILNRLTFIGAIYITIVCLMPMVLQTSFGVQFNLGGTSLLIVVVVVMDFMAQLQAHLTSHQYDNQSLMKKSTAHPKG
ncbi:preprotein translocase subunit SecY [Acinetobacter qingfengensis]|uniref:Protein translocase subunit SecY n=1 Tax=Acinetobacter qingfengensis TaxID=1262585 RepID=A0A1E7R2X2_9GAMM|nr:preprotein translocase subunit SecY [Acinetobacter qingfengensis]KAA8733937.1 preprotein translocase subunit SecY [Acinetobacter qingfengensis]OEY93666.1 preprotein translocase subunit SecY [Acinetobacter qingfengensis]